MGLKDNSNCTPKGNKHKLKQEILDIWSELLELSQEKIGFDNNFFTLGGCSLKLIQLINRLKRKHKIQLELISIDDFTINNLVSLIESQIAENNDLISDQVGYNGSIVVMIKKGNSASNVPPLILVHPIGGRVNAYHNLALTVPDEQFVYAIRSAYLYSNKIFNSIEEMAAAYVQELWNLDIKPPYILGGASFGGAVACHMAEIIYNKGMEIPMLVIIDTPAYNNLPKFFDSTDILEFISNHILTTLAIPQGKLRSINDLEKQIQYFVDRAESLGKSEILPPEFGLPLIDTWYMHQKLLMRYIPSPIFTSMMFLYAAEAIFWPSTKMPMFHMRQDLNWAKLAKGSFKAFCVPGNHVSMLHKPNINIFSTLISKGA